MSLVSEIVVEQGNENLDVDGWRVCSFWVKTLMEMNL